MILLTFVHFYYYYLIKVCTQYLLKQELGFILFKLLNFSDPSAEFSQPLNLHIRVSEALKVSTRFFAIWKNLVWGLTQNLCHLTEACF